MSENLDLVRSIYSDWERGDFRSTAWADPPELELVSPDSIEGDVLTGLASTEKRWRQWLSA